MSYFKSHSATFFRPVELATCNSDLPSLSVDRPAGPPQIPPQDSIYRMASSEQLGWLSTPIILDTSDLDRHLGPHSGSRRWGNLELKVAIFTDTYGTLTLNWDRWLHDLGGIKKQQDLCLFKVVFSLVMIRFLIFFLSQREEEQPPPAGWNRVRTGGG